MDALTIALIAVAIFLLIVIFLIIWIFVSKEGLDYVLPLVSTSPNSNQPMNTVLTGALPASLRLEFAGTPYFHSQDTPIPTSFDARVQWPGKISTSLNQRACGSCWAFATCTSASDRIRIASDGKQLSDTICYQNLNPNSPSGIENFTTINTLSPYHLAACLDCTKMAQSGIPRLVQLSNFLSNYTPPGSANSEVLCSGGTPCDGGLIQAGYYYISEGGVTALACDPEPFAPANSNDPTSQYKLCENNATCLYVGSTQSPSDVLNLSVGNDINSIVSNIKREVMMRGPLAAGFSVYNNFFDFFTNTPMGIYTTPSGGVVGGHAVTIAGWGTENGVDYWLIRNSWGHLWGVEGYFKMKINIDVPDTDKLENNAFAIIMSTQPVNSNYQPTTCNCPFKPCPSAT